MYHWETIIVWFISAKENYHNLMKNSPKFQANVTERRTSLSKRSRMFRQNLLKVPEKVESLKIHYCTWTSSQVIFKVSSRTFLHLFTYRLIYRSLLVSYIAHIMCIRIHICKRYYFPLLLFLRWKGKEKWVFDFGLHSPVDLINFFNIIILFNKFF